MSERQQASQPALSFAGGDEGAEDLSDVPCAFTPVTTSTWTVLLAARTLTTSASAYDDRVGAGRLGDGCERLGILASEAVGHLERSGTLSAS